MFDLRSIFGAKASEPSAFETILKKRFDKSANQNYALIREYILYAADNKLNADIQINNAKEDQVANYLALQKIIESADKLIRVLTTDLKDNAISRPQIRRKLSKWLSEDSDRHICILLKSQNIDYRESYFYQKLVNEVDLDQVEIRYTDCSDIIDCRYNVVSNDRGAFKIKEITKDKEEKVIINYNDVKSSVLIMSDLKDIFDEKLTSVSGVKEVQNQYCGIQIELNLSERVRNKYEGITRVIPGDFSPRKQFALG